MKNFRWILLAGLLVTAPQLAQAQPPSGPGSAGPGSAGTPGTTAADTGSISNGAAATTTTTTTTAAAPVAPDASGLSAEDAATGSTSDSTSSAPNTGGEPMLVALAGLSVAAMAFGLRRKVGNVSA